MGRVDRGRHSRPPVPVVVAVPVAPPETVAALLGEADTVVCLEQPADFQAVGAHYRDFHQLGDDEVLAALASVPAGATSPSTRPAPGA